MILHVRNVEVTVVAHLNAERVSQLGLGGRNAISVVIELPVPARVLMVPEAASTFRTRLFWVSAM